MWTDKVTCIFTAGSTMDKRVNDFIDRPYQSLPIAALPQSALRRLEHCPFTSPDLEHLAELCGLGGVDFVDSIKLKPKHSSVRSVLEAWMRIGGKKATLGSLAECLLKMERHDVLECIKDETSEFFLSLSKKFLH